MKQILIFLLFTWSTWTEAAEKPFEGYKVYRLKPTTIDQLAELYNLTHNLNYDFWKEPNDVGNPVDVMVQPKHQDEFIRTIYEYGIAMTEFIPNVQSLMSGQFVGELDKTRDMYWDRYYNLTNIYLWLDQVWKANLGRAYTMSAGFSDSGSPLKGIQLKDVTKKVIIIDGGFHSREWITTATVNGLIEELINSTDPRVQRIAESFEWHLIPTLNPDGYSYTHFNVTNRLWHRTRTPYGECRGADANKNWDTHWMEHASSDVPCLNSYAGPKAFSERETSTMSAFLKLTSMNRDIVMYVSLRAYSQSLLVPYGYSKDPLDNYNDTIEIGKKAIEALTELYGTKYRLGTMGKIIGLSSGGVADWVKEVHKVPLVYTYELGDSNSYGYLVPASKIAQTIEEVLYSLVALLEEAENFGYVKLNDASDYFESDMF